MVYTPAAQHAAQDVAQTLASMFSPSPHSGSPSPGGHGETRSVDFSALPFDSTPSPAAKKYSPTPRRSTTRGRKLAEITLESISDLPPHEQAMVLGYSRKYQQKAAALFRVLKHDNAHKLCSKSLLKPCDTCASQDWPCVLVITNTFGIRKQISRCVGCRHTRSTCSLKESAKDWDDTDNRSPWDLVDDGRASSAPAGASVTPSPATNNAPLPYDAVFDFPASVPSDIQHFLQTIGQNLHQLHPDTVAAVYSLAESVGAYMPAGHAAYGHSHSQDHSHHYTPAPGSASYGPYPSPPASRRLSEEPTDQYYSSYPRRDGYEYEPQHHRHSSEEYERRRFSSSVSSSPSNRLTTPSLTPVREGEPMFFQYTPMDMSPNRGLDLDTGAPSTPERNYGSHARRPSTSNVKYAMHKRGSPYPKTSKDTKYEPREARTSASPDIEDAHILLTLGQGRSVSLPASGASGSDACAQGSASRASSEAPAKATYAKRPFWRTE